MLRIADLLDFHPYIWSIKHESTLGCIIEVPMFVLKVCLYDVEQLSCTNSLRRRLVPILNHDSGLKEHISYNQSIIEWRCAIDSIIKLLFFIMQQYDSNYWFTMLFYRFACWGNWYAFLSSTLFSYKLLLFSKLLPVFRQEYQRAQIKIKPEVLSANCLQT